MRIILDIDDVCAELVSTWLTKYNIDWNDNLTKDMITDWNVGSFSKIGDKFYDYLNMPNFNLYENMPMVEGALDGVNYLRSLGYEIIFCTIYDYNNRKWDWLVKNKFTNNPDEYVVAHNKNLIKGDIIIDDNYDNFINYDGIKFLYTQNWNRKFHTIFRVNGWKEIIEKLEVLKMIEDGV